MESQLPLKPVALCPGAAKLRRKFFEKTRSSERDCLGQSHPRERILGLLLLPVELVGFGVAERERGGRLFIVYVQIMDVANCSSKINETTQPLLKKTLTVENGKRTAPFVYPSLNLSSWRFYSCNNIITAAKGPCQVLVDIDQISHLNK